MDQREAWVEIRVLVHAGGQEPAATGACSGTIQFRVRGLHGRLLPELPAGRCGPVHAAATITDRSLAEQHLLVLWDGQLACAAAVDAESGRSIRGPAARRRWIKQGGDLWAAATG